ncbi:MAG: hypothetical protein LBR58_04545 [Propionibacteriaceae bacterium]|nr:hypothetical protein [Propionibacteriaceae bacterium]
MNRLRRWTSRARNAWRYARLAVWNRISWRSVLGDGPVVSLTTYGPRRRTAYRAIESIGLGMLRPSRLVLVLTEADASEIPPSLRRLERRGLEILRVPEDLGPHKKYYPLVTADPPPPAVVTADDDIYYERSWLALLARAAQDNPDIVHCHRAWFIGLDEDGMTAYITWQPAPGGVASHRLLITGGAGALYTQAAITALREAGDGFKLVAPRTDDIWISHTLFRAGIRAARLRTPFRHVPLQASRLDPAALARENRLGGGNDRTLAALYTPADIAALRTEPDI